MREALKVKTPAGVITVLACDGPEETHPGVEVLINDAMAAAVECDPTGSVQIRAYDQTSDEPRHRYAWEGPCVLVGQWRDGHLSASLHRSHAKALSHAARLAREDWPHDAEPLPDDDKEALAIFQERTGHTLTILEGLVLPHAEAEVTS